MVGPDVSVPGLNPNLFEPLGICLTYPFVIAASSDAPSLTMQELADHSQSEPQLLGHFGSFLLPAQATFAAAKEFGFEWGGQAPAAALDCNSLALGDYHVINTTIQQLLLCLDSVKIVTTITDAPISVFPDMPMLSSITPDLNISLWNSLFVQKDTSQEIRETIIALAKETMGSDRAKDLAAQTEAIVHWMDAAAATARIASDNEASGRIATLFSE